MLRMKHQFLPLFPLIQEKTMMVFSAFFLSKRGLMLKVTLWPTLSQQRVAPKWLWSPLCWYCFPGSLAVVSALLLLVYLFLPCQEAHGIVAPQLGVEPTSLAVDARSLNPWTAREVLVLCVLNISCFQFSCIFECSKKNIPLKEYWFRCSRSTIPQPRMFALGRYRQLECMFTSAVI